MKIHLLSVKINMDGNLEDFALNHGNQQTNFLEMDRTFYSVLKIKMKCQFIDGKVLGINICMQTIGRLDWGEVKIKEDLLFH